MGQIMAKNKVFKTKDGERIGLFGASGCGKTTKARQLLTNVKRLIIFDSVKNEWAINGRKWLKRPVIVVNSGDSLNSHLKRRFKTPEFCIIFTPKFGEEIQQLNEVAKAVFMAQAEYGLTHNASITLFVEEAQEAIPSGLARKMPKHHALILARMGRARGINFVVASQRFKTVDITIRANLSRFYIFRLAELADIKEANNYVKDLNMLASLPNLTYYYISPESTNERKIGHLKF